MQPDLRGEVSGDDRGEPLVTESNGPLMARTRGAGFPALVQGRSCRVRVGRQGVKQRGRRGHTHGGTGGRPPAWTGL
jgi:hypothetical protein